MLINRTEPSLVGDALSAGAVFNSAMVAPADCFDTWRESMGPWQDIQPVQQDRGAPRVSSTGWVLDDLVFNDLAFSPISYRRRSGKVGDYLLLRLYREGHADGTFNDAAFGTQPGEIHLFDQSLECRGRTTDWHHVQSVFMPYSAVQYEPRHHPAHVRVHPDTAVGRILRSMIESLFAQVPYTRRAEASTLAAGFSGLVRGLLLTNAPTAATSRDFETARRDAMRRYLEANLNDPELGVRSLCAAFGASRATIYRDFAGEGGVARFVTRRRLERAFRDLAGGPPDRGRVRRIAERWGFACPYHFSRAFHKQFGLWPREVFEAGHPTAAGYAPSARSGAVGVPDDRAAAIGARADA